MADRAIIINGATYTPEELKAKAAAAKQPTKRAARDDSQRKFACYRVVGYQQGQIDAAKVKHDLEQEGAEFPKPWTIEGFLQSNKPKPVTNKLYPLRSAADECMALAQYAGFLYVRVEEITR